MKIKRKNLARLASISTLGAGVLGVPAGAVAAGVIQYTPLNGHVGFSSGYNSSFAAAIVPGIVASFRRSTFGGSGGNYFGKVDLSANLQNSSVTAANGFLLFKGANVTAGRKWSTAGGGTGTAVRLGVRSASSSFRGTNGDFYKLFAFTPSGSTAPDYGWIALHQIVTATVGPDVDILGIAWDNTGAQIAAGDTGVVAAPTPEPSTAALGSLAALALGATGLRRWRQVRRQQAA